MKLINILPNFYVKNKYVEVGKSFGDMVSYLYMGEPVGFQETLSSWMQWEQEYARRGFRTISLDRFIDYGGHGHSLDDVVGKKRKDEESPIFHSSIFDKKYRGRFLPEAIDLKGVAKVDEDGNIDEAFGSYELPTTEDN